MTRFLWAELPDAILTELKEKYEARLHRTVIEAWLVSVGYADWPPWSAIVRHGEKQGWCRSKEWPTDVAEFVQEHGRDMADAALVAELEDRFGFERNTGDIAQWRCRHGLLKEYPLVSTPQRFTRRHYEVEMV